MKNLILTVALVLCITPSFAQSGASIEDLATCPYQNKNDKYETPVKFSSGSMFYADLCMDTDRFRPPVIIESTDSLKFANYKHNAATIDDSNSGRYYIAEIKNSEKNNVEKTFFHVVRFATGVAGVTAAHTQFRVKFKNPKAVKLTDQLTGDVLYTNDVVVSYEASRPRNIPYNFAHGSWDNYILVTRAMSGRQRQNESYANETEQYPLNFKDASEGWTLLKNSIQEGDNIKFTKFYNTIKPNCTTQVFDQLDKLPSVAAKGVEAFLTEISPNPIAGPSIEAITQRGLFKKGQRYANLRAELDEGKTKFDGKDVIVKSDPFYAQVKNFPYSVVFAADAGANSQKLIKNAKKKLYRLLPEISAKLYTSMATSSLNKELSPVDTLNMIAPALQQVMAELNSELTSDEQFLSIYFLPWDGSGKEVDVMQELNVPARLPSDTFESSFDDVAYDSIFKDGFYDALDINKKSSLPATLLGLGLHMTLKKDQSQSLLQFVAQLTPQEKDMNVINDQVVISKLVIPEDTKFANPAVMILNMEMQYNKNLPRVYAEFGPYAGIQGVADASGFGGKFVTNRQDCEIRKSSVPRLQGKIKLFGFNTPFGIDFNFFDVEFDVTKLEVSDLAVRVSPFTGGCYDMDNVEQQFKDEINTKIEAMKDEKTQQGENALMSKINSFLDNNKDKKVAGFAD